MVLSRARRLLLPLLISMACSLILSGCVPQQARRSFSRWPTLSKGERSGAMGKAQTLKAHLRNGDVLIFDEWDLDRSLELVEGHARHLDADRRLVSEGNFTVAADTVAIFETDGVSASANSSFLVGFTIASVGVSVYCLANPKACFGSCPTFYLHGDDGWHLVAEGFSASVAPSLESRDVDALGRSRSGRHDIELRMTNEAYETHMVRGAALLVFPTHGDTRVGQLPSGRFREIRELSPPLVAADERGDILPRVRDTDGDEWWSAADSTDLQSCEELVFDFEASEAGEFGLYVGARQSLLTTYLFYQALAYLGDSAPAWIARLESGTLPTAQRPFEIGERLGGIEVLVPGRDEGWRSCGILREPGPLAVDHGLVELGTLEAGRHRVRLRVNRGLWRIDRVALARLGSEVRPTRIVPRRVERVVEGEAHEDAEALAALLADDRRLPSLPGDEYRIFYALPEGLDSVECFLESRGYYLEWMRNEWKAGKNPWFAAQMFVDPAGALKRMAPEYKKIEPQMEGFFQRSRFARP